MPSDRVIDRHQIYDALRAVVGRASQPHASGSEDAMIPLLQSHATALQLNTQLFFNCLENMTDEDAQRRVSDTANSMSFIAAHLIDARHFLGASVGVQIPNPVGDTLSTVKSIDEVVSLPSVPELRAAWLTITQHLGAQLEHLTADDLALGSKQQFPVDDPTMMGGITFLLHHESYHIGQLGLLRKQLGYDSMNYESSVTAEHD